MDPFSQVYNELWNLAEASQPLTQLVRVKNRIKFNPTKIFDPVKREVSQADLPELMLTSSTSTANLHNTSSTSMILRSYDWIISTGNLSVVGLLNPIEFALFCAMINWPEILGALTWEEEHFVKRANFKDITTGLTDSERNRGIQGWSAIWSLEVEFHLPTSKLLEFNTGEI